MNILKNQRGFGMIEVLISFAILGAGMYTIMEGLDYIENKKNASNKDVALESMLSSVVESIRSNIIMEKVDFQASQTWLNNSTHQAIKDSLKMCWNADGLIPIENYPNCPGRMGYVVSPMKTGNLEFRGLYQVTIRLTHDEQFPGRSREYQFIVRGP